MKVLFVCLGNICRSPMAHAILRNKAKQQNLNIEVDSCATSDYNTGDFAHIGTVNKLKEYNIDSSGLYARQIKASDLEEFDYIFTMDNNNYKNVIAKFGKSSKVIKITSLLETDYQEVPDPWYTGNFDEVYELLDKLTDEIINQFYFPKITIEAIKTEQERSIATKFAVDNVDYIMFITNALKNDNFFSKTKPYIIYQNQEVVGLITYFPNHNSLEIFRTNINQKQSNVIDEFLKAKQYNQVKYINFANDSGQGLSLEQRKIKESYLAKTNNQENSKYEPSFEIKKLVAEDEVCQKYLDSLKQIKEFSNDDLTLEKLKANLKDNEYYYIEIDNQLISSVAINYGEDSGVVLSVYTLPDYRTQGYAKTLIQYIINKYQTKDRALYLFYNNPVAGELYQKLGFTTYGDYYLCERKQHD